MNQNLPVILLNGTILMPYDDIKVEFSDEASKNIIDEADYFHNNEILIVTKNYIGKNIITESLPNIGTLAKVVRKLELPNGKIRAQIKGIERIEVLEYIKIDDETLESIVSKIPECGINKEEEQGIIKKLYTELEQYTEELPYMSNGMLARISNCTNLGEMTDIIVSNLPLDNIKKFNYLIEKDPVKRAEMILEDIYKEQQLYNLESDIDTKVKQELDKDQKDFYLKEKIKHLKRELGEISPKEEEIIKLRNRLEKLDLNEQIRNKILYEIDRYENMSNMSPEVSSVRSYIDLLLELPWNIYSNDSEDLTIIEKKLDETHYGLDAVKSRILEYLAVKKHSNMVSTPIICLVGPPGVGKTTLAYSIAQSIGRKFVKISVGGVDDEAVIKGHIRTYLGSSPGRIIDGIRRAHSMNPVFLIDEIDKMSSNYKGDPYSALLEVLDYSQNKYYKDNYVEEEFDLSNVLFITTANNIDDIPYALRDRLEIINIEGYTEYEKLAICKNYLIPTICSNHNISEIKISDENILKIIRNYTKELGIRQLDRMISKIVRKIVVKKYIYKKRVSLNIKNIEEYLGKVIYEDNQISDDVGIVNALACTLSGGSVIQIETNYFDGDGKITITGSLGEVMKESIEIALSYIKSNYKKFGINKDIFKSDVHINIPNIAVKKDGPSAGCAIVTSIISAFSDMKISNKISMTGEITLRGNILKIGGLKEKTIAASASNIDTIFIPYSNVSELDEIPAEIKNKVNIIPVKKYDEIYKYIKEHANE